MSFEGVFENWLKTHDPEEERADQTREAPDHQQISHPIRETAVKDGAELRQDPSGTGPTRHPALTSLAAVPAKQAGETIQSSSPPYIHISCPPGDVQDRQPRKAVLTHGHGDQVKDCRERIKYLDKKSVISAVDCRRWKATMPAEGQDHRQCHSHSPLTDLRDLTPSTSPAGAEVGRIHPVLSPEHDTPMEPDSTSECLLTSKSSRCRRKCEVGMHKLYQSRGDSPCGAGKLVSGVKPGAVSVHVEESPAECDSTCMFLASPHAISPASQGEVEEGMCPFVTEHEDGASPAHCVCQCQSLPTANLLPRDHVPTITTATSASPPSLASPHLTVKIISTKTDSGSSSEVSLKSPLLSPKTQYECKATSDLEHFVTKLDLRRKRIDEKQQNDTGVATLQDKDFVKGCLTQYAKSDSAASANVAKVKNNTSVVIKRQLESSDLGMNDAGTSRCESIHSDEFAVKRDTKQNEVCDFAKHIDWDTAVAETFESSTSVKGYNGESKPGIILKIRAKAVVPCLERNLDPNSVQPASAAKRKRESVGSPEILSRLRKRQKSEAATSERSSCSSEQAQCQVPASHHKEKNKELRSDTASGVTCHTMALTLRHRRRNTVHLGGDLNCDARHLSPRDLKFVECTTRLSRLQTLTHCLVFSLFPALRQQLNHTTPESRRFTAIVDDIIASLERSDSDEIVKDFEDLSEQLETLRVAEVDVVPVYSPAVVLCGDPRHSLEEFQHKVCSLLQLLLPDLTVSVSERFLQSPGQLEGLLKQVLTANQIKDKAGRRCRLFSC